MFYAPGDYPRTIGADAGQPCHPFRRLQRSAHLRHRRDVAPRRRCGHAAADSIARWEGDTLVVETTHVRTESPIRLSVGFTPLIFRNNAKLVERFTLVAADEILYQFTVEDPEVYARPWLAEYSMMRTSKRQFEMACHEGNYSLTHILQGAREQENRSVVSSSVNR